MELSDAEQKQFVRAAQCLTEDEILDAFRLAAVRDERLDSTAADLLNDFKVRKLKKYHIEFSAPPRVAVSGLDQVKQWFQERTQLFSDQASQVNLTASNLSNANLTFANLTEATLDFANLTDASLRNANLTEAKLLSANLTDAQLEQANLTDANLRLTNLSETKIDESAIRE